MHALTDNARRYLRSPWRPVVRGLLLCAVLACLWPAVAANSVVVFKVDPNGSAMAARTLMQAHGCWTGFAPEGATAHHVVVTLEGHDQPTYGGQRLTDRALEQVLFHEGHVGQVWGFCR